MGGHGEGTMFRPLERHLSMNDLEQALISFGHHDEPIPAWLTIALVCVWAAGTIVTFAWGA
jgi:hypothetical protein